ncbi:tetratricopeptide repeat protein 28-like isoform X3 [Amphibalanus amphitrite]|uniref:tetratricopeptide repeat protein 28-like isoform X3 n=1 Tax=Amphibalanus amphitrite TaxID=1232801 RepID=UPI001C90226C|nr:tetratricopeptide repeat protein 28-like isoform X3 [Amphibalanus amphitrite]
MSRSVNSDYGVLPARGILRKKQAGEQKQGSVCGQSDTALLERPGKKAPSAEAQAQAYYRQGVALQCMGRHGEALAAFSQGLAQDPKSMQLLSGLVEAAMKSPLRATLEPTYRQLQAMRLDMSPFVIISVIGQELLAAGKYSAAVVVLESALKIGTCSLKLRGSVFSALSSAYWAMNSLDKAISYMQQDLSVAKSLGDIAGECRAHGNLGSAYFSKGNFKEALTSHRYQLVLAMKCKDTQAAAAALTSLGHVYTAISDYPNALASHKQCVQLVRQLGDQLQEAREIGNVGAVYLAMGDFDNAVDCHMEHLRISKQLGNKVEEARAFSNLGSSHHYRRSFDQAITFHQQVLRIAQQLRDRTIEARAYAGLGHAARCLADYSQAKKWHEKQLDMALSTKDRTAEGRACSNLGIVYQLLGDHDAALKLHQAHLNIARLLQDRAGMGRAYGNIGNAYSSMGYYEQAIKYHKQELTISKEVNDRSSEASTHGNLAVAYQALGMHEMALLHYLSHLNIARELKDTAGEACALCNLGNCHSSRGEFALAVPYYEQYLMLSQELQDVEGEAKACHFLGYAHYCLANYSEAVRYYDQDLALAKDLQDKMSMGRAYCNLGLAHAALGNYEKALECQKFFHAIAHMMKHTQGTFRALGNMGDALMKMAQFDEAVPYYHKQLAAAKQSRDRPLEACAYGALGMAHRVLRQFDKALGFHTQELTIRQEMADLRGECKAHGHLGAVHMSLANYTNAIKCYEEQLDRAKDLRDAIMEAQAFGNLGIARLNMSHFEDAIGYFEQQLATLEQIPTGAALMDKARSFGNLGDCYDAIGDYEEAIKCHEQFLSIALKLKSTKDQERAYRGLGGSHKSLGNLQQALVCYEKRLVVSHEVHNPQAKASAYGELGDIHGKLGNFEQAISCLDHQLNIARELEDAVMEAEAASGLGCVHQQMGDFQAALEFHQLDAAISGRSGHAAGQARAHGNLGAAHESLGSFEQAVTHLEQQLSVAAQINDKAAKTAAYASLGRIHHALGNTTQAIAYLQQGLQIAEQLSRREEEARLRHRLGLALWGHGDLSGAQTQLERAAFLLEGVRREARGTSQHRLGLYDLQTAAFQALQRVLVSLGCHDEALVVAERSRTRAFADLLLERSNSGFSSSRFTRVDDNTPTSVEQIVEAVGRQKATVLYYSLAAGFLYSWLIVPGRGIVKFHQINVSETEAQRDDGGTSADSSGTSGTLLESYIRSVREALGVELQTAGMARSEDTDAGDMWQQHLEELGDRLNQEGDKTGFLRMVNRNHVCNSSNYSLSSMFSAFSCSLGSVTGSMASGSQSRAGSVRSRRAAWQGPQCLRSLYELLIAPMEEHLPSSAYPRDLMLVLEGDLYLVPFPVLKGPDSSEFLCERYNLILVPSISTLRTNGRSSRAAKTSGEHTSALVVGNPRLPSALSEQWGWTDIPYAEQEANIVAEMLQTEPVTGAAASKEALLQQLAQMECIHFATHVSWKLSAVVLSPGEFVDARHSKRPPSLHGSQADSLQEDDQSEAASTSDLPPLSEFLLTAADILSLKLTAKLVVVSSCHTRDHHGRASSDGVVGLTRALLAAGAQCVLVSLWPVTDTAVKILYRTFYSSLLQGARVSRALNDAMQTVQNTKHFAHPANWAGYLLVGTDVKLTNKVALMGQALCELLQQPDKCRDALRVTLHLMEKSLQRIHRGHKNAMYTTQKSIESKVNGLSGWKELLISVGFRFEPAANGIPSSVFFPQSDPGQRLTQCSASLQALLGLSPASLSALCKLLAHRDQAEEVIGVIRGLLGQPAAAADTDSDTIETTVSVRLWRVSGCHELLASLGFDLMEVGRDEVHLRTGKNANKRHIQFALQALLALFDTQEAPKSLEIEFSSSADTSDEESDDELPPPPAADPSPFGPAPQRPLVLGSGAFSSYVRRRGEPDGARSSTLDHPPHPKGRESDAAFTPSPVDAVQKGLRSVRSQHPSPAETGSPQPSPRLSLTLSHQNKIRSLYSGERRPDSSSSASSMADWENGQATTRRQTVAAPAPAAPPPPPLLNRAVADVSAGLNRGARLLQKTGSHASSGFESQSSDSDLGPRRAPGTVRPVRSVYKTAGASTTLKLNHAAVGGQLDKLSVRTELRRPAPSSAAPAAAGAAAAAPTATQRARRDRSNERQLAGGRQQRPAAGPVDDLMRGADELGGAGKGLGHKSIQDHIIATQMSRLRELPITDVYHERSIGLGLAPPLSKLLMSAHERGVDVDAAGGASDEFGGFDKLSVSGDSVAAGPTKPDFKPKAPPVPPKRVGPKPWSGPHPHQGSLLEQLAAGSCKSSPSGSSDLSRRDDGDGRSMTDSNYSSYSPSQPRGGELSFYAAAEVHRDAAALSRVASKEHLLAAGAGGDAFGVFNPCFEPESQGISVSTRHQTDQIAEYMDQVLGGKDEADRARTLRRPAKLAWAKQKAAGQKGLTQTGHPPAEC